MFSMEITICGERYRLEQQEDETVVFCTSEGKVIESFSEQDPISEFIETLKQKSYDDLKKLVEKKDREIAALEHRLQTLEEDNDDMILP